MGIRDGQLPVSTIDITKFVRITEGDAPRRVPAGELKAFLDSLDFCLDTGTANAYVLTPTIPITAYVAGQIYKFKALNANTGASTINISGVGTKSLVKSGNITLVVGDIPKDAIISAIYDGTNFQIIPDYSAQLSERVKQTTSDITYYVDTVNGNDTNNGLTSGTSFKTIGKAIALIPQVVNHNVTINVAVGTYTETVSICGFTGKGFIKITGASALSDSYIVQNFIINYNYCRVLVSGFKCNNTSADSVSVTSCISVELFYIKSDVSTASYNGIIISNSFAKAYNCNISNHLYALYAAQLSIILSRDWTVGTGNTYGLASNYASTIGKSGIQPQGTTSEYTLNGGVIR